MRLNGKNQEIGRDGFLLWRILPLGFFSLWRQLHSLALNFSLSHDPNPLSPSLHHLFLTDSPASLLQRCLCLHCAYHNHPVDFPHLQMLRLITSARSLLPWKITYSQALETRMWASFGEGYDLAYHNL